MRISKLIFVALLLITTVPACDDEPENLLNEETYISVFSELLILRQINDRQLQSASRDSLEIRVYDKYGINREQFETSHHYFQQNPEAHIKRIERIQEILEQEQATLRKNVNIEIQEMKRAAEGTVDNEETNLTKGDS